MSELPTILVTNGWKTDRNRKLTSVVIPSSVKTLRAPTSVTFMGTVLNEIPSKADVLQELSCPNCIAINNINSAIFFNSYSSLISISFPKVETINQGAYSFIAACNALSTVSFPKLKSITHSTGSSGFVYNCTNLTTVSCPEVETITCSNGAILYGTAITSIDFSGLTTANLSSNGRFTGDSVTGLQTVSFPKIRNIYANSSGGGLLYSNTGLTSITLGSIGNPVASIGKYAFNKCTQSGLTIIIYTEGGTSLADEPWGATNSTRVYRAA